MPQFSKHFVGIRYRTAGFRSHLDQGDLFRSEESFRTTELWGRFYPLPKMQVLAFVPYQFHEQRTGAERYTLDGMGDMTLLANYQLWQSAKEGTLGTKHILMAGGGAKLATGRYRYGPNDFSHVANANFQLGTGSLDWLATLQYTFRKGKWGVSADVMARFNGENDMDYRFGNRQQANLAAFYIQKIGNYVGLMPHVGLYAERSAHDQRRGMAVDYTGGHLLAAAPGLDAYLGKRWALGATWQKPLAQQLGGGNVHAEQRMALHLTVLL